MISRALSSITRKRVFRTLPGGGFRLSIPKRSASSAVCAESSAVLHGVPRARGLEMQWINKSRRRPNRPYGGMYTSKITRSIIMQRAREQK